MNRLVALLLLVSCAFAVAQSSSRNEVVRLVSVNLEGGKKRVVMRSKDATYVFYCDLGADGCLTPIPGKPYWLITENSTGKYNLAWLKYWYVEYHNAQTVGIVPAWVGEHLDFVRDHRLVGAYWLSSLRATP